MPEHERGIVDVEFPEPEHWRYPEIIEVGTLTDTGDTYLDVTDRTGVTTRIVLPPGTLTTIEEMVAGTWGKDKTPPQTPQPLVRHRRLPG